MNPQPPQMPEKPNVAENDSSMVSYRVRMGAYEKQLADFQKSMAEVKALGPNFWGEVNSYNKCRDLQWESEEVKARNLNDVHVKNLRNRLQNDTWILAEAQKEPMDIDHKKMSQSDALCGNAGSIYYG